MTDETKPSTTSICPAPSLWANEIGQARIQPADHNKGHLFMRCILFSLAVITVANHASAQPAAVRHAKPMTYVEAEQKKQLIKASAPFDALRYAYFLGVTPSQCRQLRSGVSQKGEIEHRMKYSAAYTLCSRIQLMPRIPAN